MHVHVTKSKVGGCTYISAAFNEILLSEDQILWIDTILKTDVKYPSPDFINNRKKFDFLNILRNK